MDAGKIHVEESSCALCESKTGSAWKCCCPDDIGELKLVSEERLRKRINLKKHQKLCQFHYKRLESGLLFGGTNIYECCAPFHVDSPKKKNLKPVPYSWRSFFQSPSSDTRYRTIQRICRECYMLAIEAINSESDAFNEEYNDLEYHSASFDLGYVSPKQWATNMSRNQRISQRSLSGSSWSLTPSTHSNSSVKAHRVSKYLKKDANSGIEKLRKRLQMPENDKTSPTHSEPDLRLPSPTSSGGYKPISKTTELPVVYPSDTPSLESTDYAKSSSFESTDYGSGPSPGDLQGDAFSDSGMESSPADESCSRASCIRLSRGYECTTSSEKAGDKCTRSEGVYVSKYIKFIYSDKGERGKKKVLSDEDLDSEDSSLTESEQPTPSDSVADIPINNAEYSDSPQSPVDDDNSIVETQSKCSALQDTPSHRVSRGPTFYPMSSVPDVSYFPDKDQPLQRNIQEVNEMLPKIETSGCSDLKPEVEELNAGGSCEESAIISKINYETTESSSGEGNLDDESFNIQQPSSPFIFENDPAEENKFEKIDESRDSISVHQKTVEQASMEYVSLKSNESNEPEITNDNNTRLDTGLEQTHQNLSNAVVEDKVKSDEKTFVGLRRRPRNTMPVPDPKILMNFESEHKTRDRDTVVKISEPVIVYPENGKESLQGGEIKDDDENIEKSEEFAKIAKTGCLYTELHGSKADEVEASKSSEESNEVRDIPQECDRRPFCDNERARQFRRKTQNISQSLFQQDIDDSDDQVEKSVNSLFTSFQTDKPSLKRSIWREKRRKFGNTFKQLTTVEDEQRKNESEHSESEEKKLDTVENEDVSAVLSEIFENVIAFVTGSHPSEEVSSKSFYLTIGVTLLLSVTISGFALLCFQ